MNPTIVDSTTAVPNRGDLAIEAVILRDGAPVDLSGKTVTATVRAEDSPEVPVNAALEDHAVVLTTAEDGVVTLTLTDAEMQMLTVPRRPTEPRRFLVSWKVMPDNYFPFPYRLYVHGVLD